MNLPDNINGVYIYRQGFYPATQLFCPGIRTNWFVITSLHNLLTPNDDVEVIGLTSHEYRVNLLNPKTNFLNLSASLEKKLETDVYEMRDIDWSSRSYTLKISNNIRVHQIFYYSD